MRNNEQGIDQQEQGSQAETPAILDGHPSAEEDKKPAGSSRKVETNRRNALKSTGPKTAAGKKRVSQNATKHGFYSKWLLVKHQDGEESQAEYDKFYAEIAEYFQPYGWHEKDLVDKIAAWSWRLRRVIRYESGQIARALAEHRYELQQSKADDTEEPGSVPANSFELDALTDHFFLTTEGTENRLRYEAMINRQLNHAIAELERLQAARKNGGITKQSQETL